MKVAIDEVWFSNLVRTVLSQKYSDNCEFTKMNYSLVYNKVYEDVRNAVQQRYGEYVNDPRKLKEDTNYLLEIYLQQYGVCVKR